MTDETQEVTMSLEPGEVEITAATPTPADYIVAESDPTDKPVKIIKGGKVI